VAVSVDYCLLRQTAAFWVRLQASLAAEVAEPLPETLRISGGGRREKPADV